METINYEKLLPSQPAEDVVAYARENGAFEKNYLIYRSERVCNPLEDRMEDAVLVTCTACGEKFYADKIKAGGCAHSGAPAPFGWLNRRTSKDVISGGETICPCCDAKAKTVHIGNMRTYGGELVDDAWVSVLDRLPVAGRRDRLMLLDWCIRRCIDKQGRTRYEIWPYTAFVVEEKKIVRLMGFRKCLTTISLLDHWEQRKTFADNYGRAGLIMPWNKRILKGTTAENCKLDLYMKAKGRYPVSYLALWRKRPAVENLLMQGGGKLVEEWIRKEVETAYYTNGIPKLEEINWKEKRPAQMLGLTKEEFRQMKKGRWSTEDLEKYRAVRDAGIPVRLPEDMKLLRTVRNYHCNQILEETPKSDFWRILRYLEKQNADWFTLNDYWRMAREDRRDLEDGLVRFPRDLKASHERQIEERRRAETRKWEAKRAKEREERVPLFLERAAALNRLSFQMDGLLIRPCATEEELIAEGRALHHCVAGYASKHASGGSAILLIRRVNKPDQPFYTLEFDEKKLVVLQNRGMRNCERTPEVKAFEKAWLESVKANRKKKGAAA